MVFSDEKIEEVRAANDVVDVVGEYVRLKKKGANYFGLCPFHTEKTPSFSVNPSLGIFKCFGCSRAGDVFRFVMEIEHVDFTEAVKLLAAKAGIALPSESGQEELENSKEPFYNALRYAGRFFHFQLAHTEGGRPAYEYLLGRGLLPETIRRFGLGYSPDEWTALLDTATRDHIPPAILEGAGLVLHNRDRGSHYDRFRGRIMYPIFSPVGKVVGYGGRVFKGEKDQPKYINSPETEVYQKSRVLYGLFQAKQAIRKYEEAILVEGYMDVISLHQAGIENVVASSGTALTPDQVRILGRYARTVVMLYDADSAGTGAALRGIDLVLEQGLSVYAVSLPSGEDPDSYVKAHGGPAFSEYVARNRQDFISFKYEEARRAGRLDTPEHQAETMHGIVRSIAHIPDPILRETYVRRAGDILRIPEISLSDSLREELRRVQPRASEKRRPEPDRQVDTAEVVDLPPSGVPVASEVLETERTLIRLLLESDASLMEFVFSRVGLALFTAGPARETAQVLLSMYEGGTTGIQPLLEGRYGAQVQDFVTELLLDKPEKSDQWREKLNIQEEPINAREEALSLMTVLRLIRLEQEMEQNKKDLFEAEGSGKDTTELKKNLIALTQMRLRLQQGKHYQ